MTPERWERINRIFGEAIELPPGQREEFLRRECMNDEEYDTVSRMVEEHFRESGPLDDRPTSPSSRARPVFAEEQIVARRYRVIRFIGRGGMGEVYEVEDQELKERVALKTLLPEIGADERMIARFKQEIQLSRRIGHPNVCRMFDLARHDAVVFLTMELLEGEPLSEKLLRAVRLAPDAALPLLEQMAAGLDAVHRAGIIHRDLKPSNVMLAGRAVLTDFGLARSFVSSEERTETQTGQAMGTVDYMAPELLTGKSATVCSDIYALGMVAYKMVTGALPFDAETPLAAPILRSKAPIPAPSSVVPGLDPVFERAILRALDAEPKRRFASAADFIKALRGEAVSMTVSIPVMTRRRWVGAAAVVVVLVAGGVGWRSWSRYRNRPPAEAVAFYQQGVDDIHAGAYFAATKALERAVGMAPRFSLAHARLAEALNELDLNERASQEMLVARRQDASRLPLVDRLQIEAIDLTVTREFDAAVKKYEQLRQADPSNAAAVEIDLGRAYEKAQAPSKAIERYKRAAEGPSHDSAAWLSLGILYSRQGNAAMSADAYERAEELYQLTSNLEGLTELEYQRGISANSRGHLAEAAQHLQKALDTARLAGNVHQFVSIELRLATNAYLSGDGASAENYSRHALITAQANQMEPLVVRGFVNLGNAYLGQREFVGAEQNYLQALAIARRSASQHLTALSLLSLAALHDQLEGRSDDVFREVQEALPFYDNNHFARETLQCFTLLGRVKTDRGDYQAAQDWFQRALELAERGQDRYQMALAHESVGDALSGQEKYPEALDHYRKSLDLGTDTQHIGYAGLHCGDVLWTLGRYAEAQQMFDRAEANARKFPALMLKIRRARAEMDLSLNKYSAAAVEAHAALEAGGNRDPLLAAQLYRVIGLSLLGMDRKAEGRRNCERALEGASHLDVFTLLEMRLALAQVKAETGDHAGAIALIEQSNPALENHPESRWRSRALLASIDREYQSAARDALGALEHLWGYDAVRLYAGRPDIRNLSKGLRPVFPTDTAIR